MDILRKIHMQYIVYIIGLKFKEKYVINRQIRTYELYDNNDYKYEAIFNIGYTDNNNNKIIYNGYGNTEKEAMENLEQRLLENKEEFLKYEAEEIFY